MSEIGLTSEQFVCTICSLNCQGILHFKVHLRKCNDRIEKRNDIIEKFKSKGQCSYCKMYGHQTIAAYTCCKVYNYYEGRSILEQIKSYYGDEYYASHFDT